LFIRPADIDEEKFFLCTYEKVVHTTRQSAFFSSSTLFLNVTSTPDPQPHPNSSPEAPYHRHSSSQPQPVHSQQQFSMKTAVSNTFRLPAMTASLPQQYRPQHPLLRAPRLQPLRHRPRLARLQRHLRRRLLPRRLRLRRRTWV
jgi:hypothetical protein